jgi:hypothetical protein
VGRTLLDLNRLSAEMTAVSRKKPRVAIFYSIPSVFWEDNRMKGNLEAVYAALAFLGQPVTFITERQLRSGKYAEVDWIILPQTTHASDEAVAELERFAKGKGKLLFLGKDNLVWDTYHRKRNVPDGLKTSTALDVPFKEKALLEPLREVLRKGGIEIADLLDAKTDKPAWGVEYRIVPYQGGFLVAMINFLHDEQTLRLPLKGRTFDLITGRGVETGRVFLKPMETVLLKVLTQN